MFYSSGFSAETLSELVDDTAQWHVMAGKNFNEEQYVMREDDTFFDAEELEAYNWLVKKRMDQILMEDYRREHEYIWQIEHQNGFKQPY